MFYYANGLLKHLLQEGSLFELSKGRLDNEKKFPNDDDEDRLEYKPSIDNSISESSTMRWRDASLHPLIIKVEDIYEVNNESHSLGKLHLLILNDGSNELVIGSIKSDMLVSSFHDVNGNCYQIEKDSVLMVTEYSLYYCTETIFNELCQYDQIHSKNVIFNLKSYTLLGKDVAYNDNLEKSSKISNETKNTTILIDQQTIEENHTKIANLNPSMSNCEWSIKAILSNMTNVREFENRQNGQKGKVMRLQFYDETGFIEAVFFNNFCDKWYKFFEKNKCYIIKKCQIKYIKSSLRAWPDSVNSYYDLVVGNNSIFEEDTTPTKINHMISNANSVTDIGDVEYKSKQKTSVLNSNKSATKEQQPNQSKSTFIQLNELLFKKNESLIDTVGIVSKINELSSINRKGKEKLALRRIEIIDETISSPISVALWGKQAEDCSFKVGKMYMFKTIKLTNFKGISLSVIRPTGILDITGMYNVSGVEKLSMWWRKNKRRFLDIDFKSNDSNDDGDDENNTNTPKKIKK